MKAALVTALAACASQRQRSKARRFLQGLSYDELEYIAGFAGACILESAPARVLASVDISPGACLDDREHKLVLALEYLRLGRPPHSQVRAV